MFTGLIDDVGTLESVAETEAGLEFRVLCGYDALEDGESIAINGACLTVRKFGPGWFTAAAVTTTVGRTAMRQWRAGARVNLERALRMGFRMGDRMGGHMVQGHVDEVAIVREAWQQDDALLADIAVSPDMFLTLVPHGSVTVDGVSLTVNALPAENVLQISLIDYTLRHTTLGDLRAGARVHVEGDVIGKYVRRLLVPYAEAE